MNLEKFVVVFENVVSRIENFAEFAVDEPRVAEYETALKGAFVQYCASINIVIGDSFVVEMYDQINAFPQRSSQFVMLANVHTETMLIRLNHTGDIVKLEPGNVLIVPNHVIFLYGLNNKDVKANNIVAYFDTFFEKDVAEA